MIVPPVSERDEVTTDGIGIAVIEMLCYAGVLALKDQRQNVNNTIVKE